MERGYCSIPQQQNGQQEQQGNHFVAAGGCGVDSGAGAGVGSVAGAGAGACSASSAPSLAFSASCSTRGSACCGSCDVLCRASSGGPSFSDSLDLASPANLKKLQMIWIDSEKKNMENFYVVNMERWNAVMQRGHTSGTRSLSC